MTRLRILVGVLILAAIAVAAAACAPRATPVKPAKIRIGAIPGVDPLPFWAAERDGQFKKAGLDVVIYVFASTQDRDTSLANGKIDCVAGDMIEIVSERSKGTPLRAVMVMSSPQPPNRHSGLVVPPGSKVTTLKELAGTPIATSIGTLQEYVLDTLMSRAGVPESEIRLLEVKKVPVRLGLLMAGDVRAAMLGEPNLSLAIQRGARLIADDGKGPALSQEVLDVREDYLNRPDGAAAILKLMEVWDQEVARINANPDAYRDLLVEKAGLPSQLSKTYKVPPYPKHELPQKADVDRLLAWMRMEKLITRPATYSDLVWSPAE